jgi:hypothetical protein
MEAHMGKTLLDLVNLALVRVGNPELSSLDGTGRAEVLSKRLYLESRDEVLRMSQWACAQKRTYLAQIPSTDLDPYEVAYAVPLDAVMVHETIPNGEYRIEGGTLFSDYLDTSSPMGVRYTSRLENPMQFDDLLFKAIGLRLAFHLAIYLVNKPQLQQSIMADLQGILPLAMNQSGIEGSGQPQATQYWDEMS